MPKGISMETFESLSLARSSSNSDRQNVLQHLFVKQPPFVDAFPFSHQRKCSLPVRVDH